MSKIKTLLNLVESLYSLADSMKDVADAIADNGETAEANETTPVQEAPAAPQPPKAPTITIDQVRAVLADKSSEGKTAQVKALLFKYDAGKLSGVKPEDYPALMEEAQKL